MMALSVLEMLVSVSSLPPSVSVSRVTDGFLLFSLSLLPGNRLLGVGFLLTGDSILLMRPRAYDL
jgi:hypothetical protein